GIAITDDVDPDLEADFAWQLSPSVVNKTGRKDYSVYGDGAIRCTVSTAGTGAPGAYEADRTAPGCD
ncbi:MAG: hypothetical protein ACE5H1_11070, partial [Thermodesulfobacteriota bacterium]